MSSKALDESLDLATAQNSYPLVASHGQFFELHPQLYGDPTTPGVAGQAGRHERMRTREQLDRMRDLVSVYTQGDDVELFFEDCG